MDRIEDFPELVDLLVIETVGGNTPVLIEFLIIEIFDLFIYFFQPFFTDGMSPTTISRGNYDGRLFCFRF